MGTMNFDLKNDIQFYDNILFIHYYTYLLQLHTTSVGNKQKRTHSTNKKAQKYVFFYNTDEFPSNRYKKRLHTITSNQINSSKQYYLVR